MTLEITNQQARKNILLHVAEHRLTQGDWHKRENDGRKIACLLGAIDPTVESTKDCNGKLMPEWLAELTVSLFDGLPNNDNIIYSTARRYGNAVGKWNVLSISQWDGILTRFLVRVIDDAVEAAGAVANTQPCWELVQTACAQVKAALNGEGDLAAADAAADAAAAYAADAAAAYAADAAVYAARAAAYAARAAADAAYAARAAADAARAAAAYAAARAVRAVRAAAAYAARAAAADAAAYAARAAAADAAAYAARAAARAVYQKLFSFLLDQIEAELASAV